MRHTAGEREGWETLGRHGGPSVGEFLSRERSNMGSARTGTADRNPSFARIAAEVVLLSMPVSSSRRTPRRAGVPSRLTQTTSGGMVWVANCAALSEMVKMWTSMGVGFFLFFGAHSFPSVHVWLARVPSLLRGEPCIAWAWRPCSAPQLGQGWSNGLCPSSVVNGRLCGLRRSPQPLLPSLLPAAIEDTGDTSAKMRRTCGVDV